MKEGMKMEGMITWLKEMTGIEEGDLQKIAEAHLPILEKIREKTQEKDAEIAALKGKLSFCKEAINSQPNPIFMKDDQLRFVFFNQAYQDFFGLRKGQYLGKRVTDLEYLSEEDRIRYQQEDTRMLETQSVIQYETFFEGADGHAIDSMYWSKGFQVSETGEKGLIGEFVDISKEKMLQRELTRYMNVLEKGIEEVRIASKIDPGTNIYNRRFLIEELPEVLESARAAGDSVCVWLTDVDDFKYINDNYGHPVGDVILEKFAQIMQSSLRRDDISIRYGGDEFAAMLFRVSLDQAKAVAERFRERVNQELFLPGGDPVTASVGLAECQGDENVFDLFRRADEALYVAKKSGKNRVAAI